MNIAKTTRITDKVRFQLRIEAFNLFNSPMYDELQYDQTPRRPTSAASTATRTGQSNFQRFVQLGFKLTW